ncbi:MAG: UvrD-helicase domain-containing protein, partial [Pseudomonadota bacterium]
PNNMMIDDSNHLLGLNDRQMEAVQHKDGPILVLAGAGTGKTKVLITRIANLLTIHNIAPQNILAVTFTNKAAQEMMQRLRDLIGYKAEGIWIGTFHSIAAKILRINSEHVNLQQNFVIIDQDDQIRLIKQIMSELEIDTKDHPPKNILAKIQSFKDKALAVHQVSANEYNGYLAAGRLLEIYQIYQERLLRSNSVDFGDLLLLNIELFKKQVIIERYNNMLNYLLVDEYQDTNIAQYLWLRLLAQKNKNICCVGDDDQSIYGWRGAEVGNILKFSKDFKHSVIVRLEQNYRSTNPILQVASSIIANNKSRLGKELWTDFAGGKPVIVTKYDNNFNEAKFIAKKCEELISSNSNIRPANIAILVRAAYQTRNFEAEFIALNLPYKIVGGLRFYERKEIKDIIAYARIIIQNDDDLAFERIINTPKRGIGNNTIDKLFKYASINNMTLFKSARMMSEEKLFSAGICRKITELIDNITRWGKMLETTHHSIVINNIAEESGYINMLKNDNSKESDGRIENITELVNALNDFKNLYQFLEHVSLVFDDERQNNDDMISIMTLHAAKGLEFDHVFLPSWDNGIFPNQRSIDETGIKAVEEERRLAYVGVTRAKKQLFISHNNYRNQFGSVMPYTPSIFLNEISDNLIEKVDMSFSSYKNNYDGGNNFNRNNNSSRQYPKSKYQKYLSEQSSSKQSYDNFDSIDYSYDESSNEKFPHNFDLNQRVTHEKFGKGTIVAMEGDVVQGWQRHSLWR